MTTFKRVAFPTTALATVLSTELNSLGIAGYSTLGSSYDNTSGLYLYGQLLIEIPSIVALSGAYVSVFMTAAVDGSKYDDVASSTNPGYHWVLPPISLNGNTSAKQALLGGLSFSLPGFPLPAALLKFQLFNGAGVAFTSSGNTVKLFGAYDQGV